MDKKSTLFIGAGAGGAKLVDAILSLDSRYEGFYINSSVKDVKPRQFAKLDRNVYVIPNSDGTGKNREKGKTYIMEQRTALADKLSQYEQFKDIVITFSMGGGTGSSFSPIIAKLISRILPNAKIHLVAIKPKMKSSKKILQNAIETWDDITKVKDICSSITLLDNDKREDEDLINKEWAEDFNDMVNLTIGDETQVLDAGDLSTLLDTKMVLNILRLNEEFADNLELAFKTAIRESIYVEPITEDCINLGIALKGNDFNKDEIEEYFFAENDVFECNTDIDNIVLVSGCELPKVAFELMEEEIKEREHEGAKRRKERLSKKEDLMIGSKKEKKKEEKKENMDIASAKSSKEIEDIFADGFFDELM